MTGRRNKMIYNKIDLRHFIDEGFRFGMVMNGALSVNDDEVAIFHGEYVQPPYQLKKSTQSNFTEGNQLLNQAIEYVMKAS